MANYKPIVKSIVGTTVDSGVINANNISTSAWGMGLLKGTTLSPTGAVLPSATILVWESTNPTTATANHTTFSDVNGRYGVTVKANLALKIRVYAR